MAKATFNQQSTRALIQHSKTPVDARRFIADMEEAKRTWKSRLEAPGGYSELTMEKIRKITERNNGKIHTGVYWIGYELANELLQTRDERQRRPHKWNSYISDHILDRMIPGSADICIGSDYKLQDGQNRLLTFVVASHMMQEYCGLKLPGFLHGVKMNMPVRAMEAMDTGKNRTDFEVAKARGIACTPQEIATARRTLKGIDHRGKISAAEIIEFYQTYRNQIMWAVQQCEGVRGTFKEVFGDELRTTLVRARICKKSIELMERFTGILRSGATDGSKRDGMVPEFGQAYVAWKDSGGDNRKWLYALVQRALRDFLDGDVRLPPRNLYRNVTHKGREILVATKKVQEYIGQPLEPLHLYQDVFPVHEWEKKLLSAQDQEEFEPPVLLFPKKA